LVGEFPNLRAKNRHCVKKSSRAASQQLINSTAREITE
jgi:hypothetical protein